MSPLRPTVLAVDWSGALHGEAHKLRVAEARDGELRAVEGGRTRAEIVEHVIERARRDPALVVGMDFAFAFPAWFPRTLGIGHVGALWEHVAERGERWLDECTPPFWGRPGCKRPPADETRPPFRGTEGTRLASGGIAPKSVFQIGGAGAVGTGSLRGMPWLTRLRAAGFSIWPFDAPRLPVVVEIYPRWFTGRVKKSSAVARGLYVAQHLDDQPAELARAAAADEDAFDAAVSALCLADALDELLAAPAATDPDVRLEGTIFAPARDAFWPETWPLRAPRHPRARPRLAG